MIAHISQTVGANENATMSSENVGSASGMMRLRWMVAGSPATPSDPMSAPAPLNA